MERKSNLRMRANVQIRILKGNVLQHVYHYKNIVVNQGRNQVGSMLGSGLVNPVTLFAWGDGGHDVGDPSQFTPADLSDTALANELLRKNIASVTQPTQTSIQFIGRLEPSELPTQGISEQALIHQGLQLFARVAHPLIIKGANQFETRWTIEI